MAITPEIREKANKTRIEKQRKAKDARMPQLALLFTCGYSITEIANSLEVSTTTISSEIKELKEGWAQSVGTINLDYFIGQLIAEAKIRKRRANEIFVKSDSSKTKISILRLLADEDQRVVNLLQSVGKLFEKPREMVIENTFKAKTYEYFEEMGSDGITQFFGALGKPKSPVQNSKGSKTQTKH